MNKSIALIGGGGFIGTNLANYFTELNYKVVVIGRSITENSSDVTKNIKRMLIDVNKTSKLIEAVSQYENIIWLVNNLVPSDTMDRLSDDFNYNVSPLVNFLESSKKLTNLKRFVFISSGGTIYGDSPNKKNFDENSQKNPISAYGLSKIIAEKYIDFITRRSSFESIIIRPSNVYGNYQNLTKPQGIVGYAFNSVLKNKPLLLYSEGNVIRDFIHVIDLAEAIKCCIENNKMIGKVETFNVGSQEGHSIREIIDYINEISNESIQIISQPARPFDCNYNVLNIGKINSELGWEPKIKIKDGLREVWCWFNSQIKH